MKFSDENPPKNARRVFAWSDLPECGSTGTYLIEDESQKPREITVGKKRQRVLEGLMRSPLFAASYARLSDHVDLLKRSGVDIETLMFRNDPETGRDTYGIYVLRSRVTRIDGQECEVAA